MKFQTAISFLLKRVILTRSKGNEKINLKQQLNEEIF